MDILERIRICAVVPVVVIDDAADAVPTARALYEGGVDVMEITFRTAAAADAIKKVADECPEVCVGAGTVLSLEQCKQAVSAGAKFIVSPGFDAEIVEWCLENNVAVTPGCVTPTDITKALSLGLKVLKFFPSNVYGGLTAMQALAAPFVGVKFIPTGGISESNLLEYLAAPFIHAVGGSWLCSRQDIAAGNFKKISEIAAKAIDISLGFELVHIGINCIDADEAMGVSRQFDGAFRTGIREGSSSIFASTGIEVMKSIFRGEHGHIAMGTANISRAIAVLSARGFEADMESARYNGDAMTAVYLKKDFGGFAVHLMQK